MKRFLVRSGAIAAVLSCLSFAALAEGPVLVQGEKAAVNVDDLQADALRMPVETRSRVLSRPDQVAQIAANLYTRRVMAHEAESAGLGADPAVAAALKIARDKVLSDAFLARMDKTNMPSDAQVEGWARNFYVANPDKFKTSDEVQIRHILIAASEENAKAKADKLLEQVKAGGDFAALAKQYSADPGSAVKGGDLGSFGRGRMVPEFDEAAFALQKPGDYSGVIKTQFGYHILQLESRRSAGVRPFDEVRADLIKDARSTILQTARVAAAEKIQQGAKTNIEAVQSFADSFKTVP